MLRILKQLHLLSVKGIPSMLLLHLRLWHLVAVNKVPIVTMEIVLSTHIPHVTAAISKRRVNTIKHHLERSQATLAPYL